MPRPKRPKLVHTVPQELRVAEPVITSTVQKRKEFISPQSSERFNNGSDDSDGLVKRMKGPQKAMLGAAKDYKMSGALAPELNGSTHSRPPSRQTRAELTRIVRDADHAKARAERMGKQHAQYLGQENEAPQVPSSRPCTALPPTRQGSGRLGPSTANLSNRNSMLPRLQSTPLAQSSMLGAIQFKKRTRQPSLLQLAQAQHDTTANLDDGEDLFDFRPDDESTPLVQSLSQINQRTSSSSSPQTSGPRKRKLASPEIQVPASQSQSQEAVSSYQSNPSLQQNDYFDLLSEDAKDAPEPTLPRLRQARTPSPQTFSDTLAPPQSDSSPVKPSPRAARREKLRSMNSKPTKPRIQHKPASHPAPSPQSTTTRSQASPQRKKPQPPKPLTTARLQNMLPRRRTRQKQQDTYDVPYSSDVELDTTQLGEDEDELSFHASTKIRRKKAAPSILKRRVGKAGKQTVEVASKGRRISKTYAHTSAVEQQLSEDDSTCSLDEDTSHDVSVEKGNAPVFGVKAKAEMKRLADKFREVDEFTLDFEDMTGSSSQLKDAR